MKRKTEEPKKSILKTPNQQHSARNSLVATFDENNIKETYHPENKEYGHMQIDEPKTPYEKESTTSHPDDKSRPVNADELNEKLLQLQQQIQTRRSSTSSVTSEEFEQKRKEHYDEFKRIQEAKRLIAEEEAALNDETDDDGAAKK